MDNDLRPNIEEMVKVIDKVQSKGVRKIDKLDKLEKLIKREFGVECEDIFVVDDRNINFFGMRIYPSKADLENITMFITDDNEKEVPVIKSFVLEIDSRLLFDPVLHASAKEVVAVLLHEIGHILNSSDTQNKLKLLMKLEAYKTLDRRGWSLKRRYSTCTELMYLYIINGLNNIGYDEEASSDAFSIKYGLGDELASIMNKVVTTGLKGTTVSLTKSDIDNDNKALAYWTIKNLGEYERRRKNIIKEIESQSREEGNSYMKIFLHDIIVKIKRNNSKIMIDENIQVPGIDRPHHWVDEVLFGYDKALDIYQDMNDRVDKDLTDLLAEGFMKDIMTRGNYRNMRKSIDEISIEIDRCETYDEKLSLLNDIYKKKFQLDDAVKYATSKNDTEMLAIIDSFKQSLDAKLKSLMDKKIKDREYGVFIKYPTGYEG